MSRAASVKISAVFLAFSWCVGNPTVLQFTLTLDPPQFGLVLSNTAAGVAPMYSSVSLCIFLYQKSSGRRDKISRGAKGACHEGGAG